MYIYIYIYTYIYIYEYVYIYTCLISAQEVWQEPGTGARLEGAEVGVVRDKGLTHTHTCVAVRCSVLQLVAACCSALQCVAVCC